MHFSARSAASPLHGPTSMTRTFVAMATIETLCFPTVVASQAPKGISFTAAQAERGRNVYTRDCASCHGSQLTDGDAVPVAGADFAGKWSSPSRTPDEGSWP